MFISLSSPPLARSGHDRHAAWPTSREAIERPNIGSVSQESIRSALSPPSFCASIAANPASALSFSQSRLDIPQFSTPQLVLVWYATADSRGRKDGGFPNVYPNFDNLSMEAHQSRKQARFWGTSRPSLPWHWDVGRRENVSVKPCCAEVLEITRLCGVTRGDSSPLALRDSFIRALPSTDGEVSD